MIPDYKMQVAVLLVYFFPGKRTEKKERVPESVF